MKSSVDVIGLGGVHDKPLEFTSCDICGREFMRPSATNSDGVLSVAAVLRGAGKAYTDICEKCGNALVETIKRLEPDYEPPADETFPEPPEPDETVSCEVCGSPVTRSDELGKFVTSVRTEHRADYPEWKNSIGLSDIRSICEACGKSIFEHIQSLRTGGKK
jgi:ribosomal protein S27E